MMKWNWKATFIMQKKIQGEATLEKKLLENYIENNIRTCKRKREQERLVNRMPMNDFNREDSPIPKKKPKLEKTSSITLPKSSSRNEHLLCML